MKHSGGGGGAYSYSRDMSGGASYKDVERGHTTASSSLVLGSGGGGHGSLAHSRGAGSGLGKTERESRKANVQRRWLYVLASMQIVE